MSAAGSIVVVAGFLVALANGANDVSKGIATLVGSGVTDYRRAIRWGTLCTALGGLAGGTLAQLIAGLKTCMGWHRHTSPSAGKA